MPISLTLAHFSTNKKPQGPCDGDKSTLFLAINKDKVSELSNSTRTETAFAGFIDPHVCVTAAFVSRKWQPSYTELPPLDNKK